MQLVKDLPIALLQSHDVASPLLFTARVPCQKSEKERRREKSAHGRGELGESQRQTREEESELGLGFSAPSSVRREGEDRKQEKRSRGRRGGRWGSGG